MSFFITFEGIEGSGKTTQISRLAAHLRARGLEVVQTREPGGCPIADAIRAILLDAANTSLVSAAELLLYAAARAQHVEEVIRPALAKGRIVLCDRFTDATLAYQGFGRGLSLAQIENLNTLARGTTVPDLTLLFDLPVEVGLRRALKRIAGTSGPAEDRFEQESRQFHERIRLGYLTLAGQEPERFRLIHADADPEQVFAEVVTVVEQRLGQGGG
ncbi:dTMP kinase [Geoalkalibacter sp.]|uniref:dTMP kinase n=1 Tax=Geoalkalibacter sp. TaxID=3041440 RepID=UPI00272EE3C8|nr:dTMP kinase [Geoalkalibacter sp.]